ncbi:LacI family DNA-binding transcriptional regulator [Lacisediminihabitans profunda]|uniref:LacI family DNA-binding transcriptional regulator n=1 Tax=Lacisediminihabitans profunda TaxID=2594790 RepID=A0A5C8UWL3_9MICO|nr:LacI family DNA-binding transcriptional regulator [Lacisediminihabitans profunda]TXN32433.1 LacI family DNA-binding transcriptional regulator [Lacisediminihabitans profunda]
MEPDKVRAPNIRDVARLAGVSYQTVSRVLNNSESIKDTTKQRVLEVIAQVGYRPNQAARALVTSRTRTIGVLTSQTAHYGPTTSLHAIEEAAREAGYLISTTSLATSDHAAIVDRLEHLMRQAVEGLVVIAPQVRVFDAIRQLEISVPLVTLDSTRRDDHRSLSVDQIAGARMATRHLIDLGHREIVHLSGPQDWIEAEARMTGFLREVDDADLTTHPPILGDWTADFGHHVGRELLRYRDFTAVFAANDQMALGLIHAFRDAGLDVPGDVSVVGFDDIPEAAHYWPPLTTVRQDFAEIGRRSVGMLLAELRGEVESSHEQVRPELIVRKSTAPPRI